MIRKSIFLAAAHLFRPFPNFKGKIRALLLLYKVLGLTNQHIHVETTLSRPVKSRFRLDLFCLHERMAFLMNGYEIETINFLDRLHRGEGAFIDIGANIGLISVALANTRRSRGMAFRAHAIEAVKSNVAALTANIALNRLESTVHVIPTGVGDAPKTVQIQVERNLAEGAGTGTANILPENSTYKCERITLNITTLDLLQAEGSIPRDVSLIKIDVDGYDLFAMFGASKFLSESRPVIFGEFMAHCLRWHGQSVTDVIQYMRSLGYETFMRRFPGWEFTSRLNHADYIQDLLIIPKERVGEFGWCLRD